MTGAAQQLKLDGYTDLPAGKIASIVTFLEMRASPEGVPDAPGAAAMGQGFALERLTGTSAGRYLAIFRTLGERWLWGSRLRMARAALTDILDDQAVEAFALMTPEGDAGLLELDLRSAGECEIVFFGVFDRLVGSGAAHWMMREALDKAWRPGIGRVWLHTCNFDHPQALAFYRRAGFTPYRMAIEVEDDPRLNGVMRREAAPHVALIG